MRLLPAFLKTRQQPLSPIRAAVNSDLVSHLSAIDIRLGRRIARDPHHERIPGDPQAAHLLDRPLREPRTI